MTLRVAIIGCGKIADQHVHAVQRIGTASIVAACDREPLMAEQLAERFRIPSCYGDPETMLREAAPDVVHITTPPQSHLSLGVTCLRAGCHVYVEKPFTVTAREASVLIETAASCGRLLTAGHNYQFTPEMLRMRRLVDEGYLGGPPVHVESYWSYDLGDVSYVAPILGNPDHWVRRMPGQLMQNVVSHGIARIVEFLRDDIADVHAIAGQSPVLRGMGGQEVKDELRILLRDRAGTTGSFCFSTQLRPGLNSLRLLGPRNSLYVDLGSGTLVEARPRGYKSYLTYVLPQLDAARQQLRNARRNALAFMRQELYQDSGMKELIARFHDAILGRGPLPVSYRDILATADVMDRAFEQVGSAAAPAKAPALQTIGPADG